MQAPLPRVDLVDLEQFDFLHAAYDRKELLQQQTVNHTVGEWNVLEDSFPWNEDVGTLAVLEFHFILHMYVDSN
jgi:hypothetical protein